MSLAGVPEPLRGARFVPLVRGQKAARVRGDAWRAGASWEPDTDAYLRSEGDLGVRLEASSPPLLVVDADVVVHSDLTASGVRDRYEDGRAQVLGLLTPTEPTLVLQSPGRPDGSHLPGWHLYYHLGAAPGGVTVRQNVRLASALEVKVNGITRLTPDMTVLRDHPVAPAPEPLLAAVASAQTARLADGTGEGVPVARYREEGIARGEQHTELLRVANSAVASGLDEPAVRELLWDVINVSEQDPSWPWSGSDVDGLVADAVAWVGRQRERERAEQADLVSRLHWL